MSNELRKRASGIANDVGDRIAASLNGEPISRKAFLAGLAATGLLGFGIGKLTNSPESSRNNDHDEQNPSEIERPLDLEAFLDKYTDSAHETEKQYGVPHEVTLAMGMLESGYGNSDLAKEASNFHGMKSNDEWNGDVFEKITTEHVHKDNLAKWKYRGEPTPIGNDMYEIKVVAEFKKFDTDEEGFLGFGEHLRTRFDGEAYADAFTEGNMKDPYKFVRALFDTNGARYATDIAYVEKVVELLNKITGKTESMANENLDMPAWNKLNDAQKSQYGSEEAYRNVVEQLSLVELSPERYRTFVDNIQDISDKVAAMDGAEKVFPSRNKIIPADNPRIALHHTAWPASALGYDAKKFVTSIINNAKNSGNIGSANYYLTRDGKTLSVLTKPDHAAYHAGRKVEGIPYYNSESTGLEVPATDNANISPELYEGVAYTVAWQYRTNNPGENPSKEDLIKYVIGHGEIAEIYPTVTDHGDFPRATADAIATLTHDLLQKI